MLHLLRLLKTDQLGSDGSKQLEETRLAETHRFLSGATIIRFPGPNSFLDPIDRLSITPAHLGAARSDDSSRGEKGCQLMSASDRKFQLHTGHSGADGTHQ